MKQWIGSTVFAGDKAAVFSEEKISKSQGAAFTLQQQNSAVKTSRPFAHMGLWTVDVQENSRITPHNLPTIFCCIVDMKTNKKGMTYFYNKICRYI